MKRLLHTAVLCFCVSISRAELSVQVDSVTQSPSKVLLKLKVHNTFAKDVQSARVHIFLMNTGGKVVGRESRRLIGDKRHPNLGVDQTMVYYLSVPKTEPFSRYEIQSTQVVLAPD